MKFEIDIGWLSGCHPCLENFAVDGDVAEIDKDKYDNLEEPTRLPWKGGGRSKKKAGKGDDGASTGSNKSSSSGSFLKSLRGRSTKGKKSSTTEPIEYALAIVDVRDDDESVVSKLDGIESKDLTSAPSRDDDKNMRDVMQDVEMLVTQLTSPLTSPMPDTKNGYIKEQTGNRTKDHKDDGSGSSGGESRSSKSSRMSWRRKAGNNKQHKEQPPPILYDYFKIIGGVSDVMVRVPYNRSLTFAELRREIEVDFAEEMPLTEYKFLINADGVAVGRSQEQKWLVRDYDMVDLTTGGDGTGLNPYLVYIKSVKETDKMLPEFIRNIGGVDGVFV
jgi:hypothetical protein